MINRNTAWKEALKQSQKRVNGFIKLINWDIKKQIKNGRFHASQTVVRQFSKEEQEEIENYYKKLKYNCGWDDIGSIFQKFRIDWEGEKINDKEERV